MDIFQFRRFDDRGPHNAVLTIGNFDGVHVGHQALIRQVVREAGELGVRSALMTFHPHPQSVLREEPPPTITTVPLRLRLFEELGLDAAYFIPFTRALAALSAQEFVREYLLSYFQVRKLIIGFDFQFGRNREGSAQLLERLSAEHGFDFEVYPEVSLGGEKVSSSRIREALGEADFAHAERLLGRPYSVLQRVVRGEQRGRQLGFPTLNQVPEERLPLPFGVYASRVAVQGRSHDAVSNYGLRPTVGGRVPTLESFLFDFDSQAYDELAEVFPLRLLRPERKFPSLEALREQISADREAARSYLRTLTAVNAP
ncbi:MAG TPA: bifunctional riboflavin kinase/FAD synthetase [bacterium]|jgi:riboflavin kinase/FMN adenylyltransferase